MATVGILGGTGPAGRGVAIRLASAGYDVVLGSRDATRAEDVATTLHAARRRRRHAAATNDAAAGCDLVVVATPWDSAVATVSALRDALADKIVISMVNALAREGRELVAALSAAWLDGRPDRPRPAREPRWSAPFITCPRRRWRTSTAGSTPTS